MVSVSSVLMAPVRGVVWLVKLPFVLVWMLLRYIGSCIYGAVAAVLRWAWIQRGWTSQKHTSSTHSRSALYSIIFRFMYRYWFVPFFSVPAYYLGRVRNRLKLTWAWAKGSATRFKLSLPFTSNCSELSIKILKHGSFKLVCTVCVHSTDVCLVWCVCVHWHFIYMNVLSVHVHAYVHGGWPRMRRMSSFLHVCGSVYVVGSYVCTCGRNTRSSWFVCVCTSWMY